MADSVGTKLVQVKKNGDVWYKGAKIGHTFPTLDREGFGGSLEGSGQLKNACGHLIRFTQRRGRRTPWPSPSTDSFRRARRVADLRLMILSRPLTPMSNYYDPIKYRSVPNPRVMSVQPLPGVVLFSHRHLQYGGFSVSDALTGLGAFRLPAATRRAAERNVLKKIRIVPPHKIRKALRLSKLKVRRDLKCR